MNTFKTRKEKINDFLFDHYKLKVTLRQGKGVFCALIAAFVFAFGFTSFISPGTLGNGFKIVTGGVSGISQNIAKIVQLAGGNIPDYLIEAMGYTFFNIPLIIFAFFKIGKRFSILTLLNVVASSAFISLIPLWGINQEIANHFLILDQPIARIIFGGLCTGVSSAIAFKGEISCGGIDIITYYMSLRKSTSVGKYSFVVNSIIVLMYSILIIIGNTNEVSTAIISMFYSTCYIFIVGMVVDAINLRNKKIQLQFITTSDNLSKILISHFPHGATITKAEGAYSHIPEHMVYMIVSSYEVKKVVGLARKVDPHVFITATSLIQVYGNFYIRPIE